MKKIYSNASPPSLRKQPVFRDATIGFPANVKQVVALQNAGRFLRLPIPVPPTVYVIIMAEYIFLSQFFLNRFIVQSTEFDLVGS